MVYIWVFGGGESVLNREVLSFQESHNLVVHLDNYVPMASTEVGIKSRWTGIFIDDIIIT